MPTDIVPLNGNWDALAALHCALAETEPEDQVLIVVIKADGTKTKYVANMTNMDVHWQAARLQYDVVRGAVGANNA